MSKETFLILHPEEIERRRALEFLALSPTEKMEALIRLIEMSNEVREAGRAARNKKPDGKH